MNTKPETARKSNTWRNWLLVAVIAVCLGPPVAMLLLFQTLILFGSNVPSFFDASALVLLLISVRFMPLWALGLFLLSLLFSQPEWGSVPLIIEACKAAGLYGLASAITISKQVILHRGEQPDRVRIISALWGVGAGVGALVLIAKFLPTPVLPKY